MKAGEIYLTEKFGVIYLITAIDIDDLIYYETMPDITGTSDYCCSLAFLEKETDGWVCIGEL